MGVTWNQPMGSSGLPSKGRDKTPLPVWDKRAQEVPPSSVSLCLPPLDWAEPVEAPGPPIGTSLGVTLPVPSSLLGTLGSCYLSGGAHGRVLIPTQAQALLPSLFRAGNRSVLCLVRSRVGVL